MRLGILIVCSACGRIGFDDVAMPDAPFATGPFGPASPVSVLNSGLVEDDVSLTSDMREIYFMSERDVAEGALFTSVRANANDPWPPPVAVPSFGLVINNPRVSGDGLTLYVASDVGLGLTDLYFATRSDRSSAWSALQPIPGINSSGDEFEPWVISGGRVLYLTYKQLPADNGDIARTERVSTADSFGPPVIVQPLLDPSYDGSVWVDENELTVVFHSDRGTGTGRDLYTATRTTTDEPLGAPVPMTDVNSIEADSDPWLSPDGRVMYWVSRRGGNDDIYMATR